MGASTPPELVLPVAGVPLALEVPVAVPPFVAPLLVVPVTGVVLVGVVPAGVVEAAVVETPVDVLVDPLATLEDAELFAEDGPASSSALLVSTGSSAGTLDGTLSLTVVPPQAASATAPSVAPTSASDCLRRVI